jgi:hypothetical protein
MSQSNDIPNPFDPLGFWRTTQNASLEAWSKAMIELVNTDAYAEATGRLLDGYLAASVPMRKAVEQAMAQVLGQINVPSRVEVLSIAERMTNIEMRLDDLDARFDDVQRSLAQITAGIESVTSAARAAQAQPKAAAATKASAAAAKSAASAKPTANRSSRTRAASAAGRTVATSRVKE